MAEPPNPPYPPFPPYPPYPPYPPVVIVVPCCCCRCGITSPAHVTTQPNGATQPSGTTTLSGTTTQPVGTTQPNTYDSIVFTITTSASNLDGIAGVGIGGGGIGAIGLSDDSSATAVLFLAGSSSSPVQTIALKTNTQPAWQTPSTKTLPFALNTPVTANALGSVVISLIPGADPPLSWDIQSVQVVLSNASGTPPPVMLLNQSAQGAAPLAALSGSNPSITLPL
jgi:hypothetical protein